jgi:hypothetical protein
MATPDLLQKRLELEAKIDDLKAARDAETNSKLSRRLDQRAKSIQRQLDDLNQRDPEMRTGIDPKGGSKKRIPTMPDEQAHHAGTSLNNARLFFNNLSREEKLLMNREFNKFGIVPGDVAMNRLDMLRELHQAGIHGIERKLGLEGKQYFEEGATFQDKLKAVSLFAEDQRLLKSVAEEAQFKATQELGGVSRRVQATATPELADEFHRVRTQRGAEMARDVLEYGPGIHESLGGQQYMPDISGRARPQLEMDPETQKARYTAPAGAVRPKAKPPIKQPRIGTQLRMVAGSATLSPVVDYGEPAEPPIGTGQIGSHMRSIEAQTNEAIQDMPGYSPFWLKLAN